MSPSINDAGIQVGYCAALCGTALLPSPAIDTEKKRIVIKELIAQSFYRYDKLLNDAKNISMKSAIASAFGTGLPFILILGVTAVTVWLSGLFVEEGLIAPGFVMQVNMMSLILFHTYTEERINSSFFPICLTSIRIVQWSHSNDQRYKLLYRKRRKHHFGISWSCKSTGCKTASSLAKFSSLPVRRFQAFEAEEMKKAADHEIMNF
jgi:hypothetical protein